jgi:hypothetical protein
MIQDQSNLQPTDKADLVAASLPSIPDPDLRSVPIGADLTQKIAILLNEISTELARGEIRQDEFGKVVFGHAKHQGILTGDYDFNNAGHVGRLIAKIERKLGLVTLHGVEADYYTLKNSKVSDEALQDVNEFTRIKAEVSSRLKTIIGNSTVARDDFERTVRSTLIGLLPQGLCTFRTAGLTGRMIGSFERSFKIQEKSKLTGQVTNQDLDDAFREEEKKGPIKGPFCFRSELKLP